MFPSQGNFAQDAKCKAALGSNTRHAVCRPSVDNAFSEIAGLIASAKVRAVQAVNTALIDLYWQVGGVISRKIAAAEWGEGVVDQLGDISSARPSRPAGLHPQEFSSGCGSFTMPGRIMN